jgi:hypothetical protein
LIIDCVFYCKGKILSYLHGFFIVFVLTNTSITSITGKDKVLRQLWLKVEGKGGALAVFIRRPTTSTGRNWPFHKFLLTLCHSTSCDPLELWSLCRVHCYYPHSPLQAHPIFTKIYQEEGKIVQGEEALFIALVQEPISADRPRSPAVLFAVGNNKGEDIGGVHMV